MLQKSGKEDNDYCSQKKNTLETEEDSFRVIFSNEIKVTKGKNKRVYVSKTMRKYGDPGM